MYAITSNGVKIVVPVSRRRKWPHTSPPDRRFWNWEPAPETTCLFWKKITASPDRIILRPFWSFAGKPGPKPGSFNWMRAPSRHPKFLMLFTPIKCSPVLKPEELPLSLKNQTRLLRPEGFVFHSFWQGEEVETLSDLSFTYYTEKALRELFAPFFHVLEIYPYNDDFFTDDSLADASLTDGSLPEETDPPANPDDDFKDSLFLIAQKK